MGIQNPEDVFISLELDEDGALEFAEGAPVSTDDANILQTRSPKMPQSAPGGTLLVEPQGESTGIAGTQR